jgi:small-conductance mechanosensitive channel
VEFSNNFQTFNIIKKPVFQPAFLSYLLLIVTYFFAGSAAFTGAGAGAAAAFTGAGAGVA